MLKKLLKMRANIWLTTGVIIVIAGLFFTSVVTLSNIDPQFADAKKECDDCPYIERRGDSSWNPFQALFGPQGIFYNPSPTQPTQERSYWSPWTPKEGNSSSAQPRANNPYPGVDPTTGRW